MGAGNRLILASLHRRRQPGVRPEHRRELFHQPSPRRVRNDEISGPGGATAIRLHPGGRPKSTPIGADVRRRCEESRQLTSALATNLYQMRPRRAAEPALALLTRPWPSPPDHPTYLDALRASRRFDRRDSLRILRLLDRLHSDPADRRDVLPGGDEHRLQESSVTYNFEVYDNVNPITAMAFGQEIAGTIRTRATGQLHLHRGCRPDSLLRRPRAAVYNSITAQLIAPNGITEEYLYPYQNSLFTLPVRGGLR